MGPTKTHVMRRQQRIEREQWIEQQRTAQETAQERERAALKMRQEQAFREKAADLSRRLKQAAAEVRRELAEQRRADVAPSGFRRALMLITGQARQQEDARRQRDADRVIAAREKLAAIKTELRAEMSSFRAGQAQESERQAGRHSGQERQLQEAIRHRSGLGQAWERTSREAGNDNATQERERHHGQGRELRLER